MLAKESHERKHSALFSKHSHERRPPKSHQKVRPFSILRVWNNKALQYVLMLRPFKRMGMVCVNLPVFSFQRLQMRQPTRQLLEQVLQECINPAVSTLPLHLPSRTRKHECSQHLFMIMSVIRRPRTKTCPRSLATIDPPSPSSEQAAPPRRSREL